MSKYKSTKDGEWVQPIRHRYKMMCCDCGLVHNMNFRIVRVGKRNFIQFQPERNYRSTAMARRGLAAIRFCEDKVWKKVAKEVVKRNGRVFK